MQIKKLMCCVLLLAAHQAFAQDVNCFKEIVNEKGWTKSESVPCPPGQQKTVEQVAREEQETMQRKCGKDYLHIRIGMKLARLEQCVGATYETETVTEKGRVETYRTTFDWVHVQNGVVIGYTKRIN